MVCIAPFTLQEVYFREEASSSFATQLLQVLTPKCTISQQLVIANTMATICFPWRSLGFPWTTQKRFPIPGTEIFVSLSTPNTHTVSSIFSFVVLSSSPSSHTPPACSLFTFLFVAVTPGDALTSRESEPTSTDKRTVAFIFLSLSCHISCYNISGSIYLLTNFIFLQLSCVHIPHLHYSSISWMNLNCFHSLTIVTKVTMKWLSKYLWDKMLSPLRICRGAI